MKIKFENYAPSQTPTSLRPLVQNTPSTSKPKLNAVYYKIKPNMDMPKELIEAIDTALQCMTYSFDLHIHHVMSDLWDIVNNKPGAHYYDDCKNYDVEIDANGAEFMVADRFETPNSVSFSGNFIRHFLWGYLTMLESPGAPFEMQITFADDWVSIV